MGPWALRHRHEQLCCRVAHGYFGYFVSMTSHGYGIRILWILQLFVDTVSVSTELQVYGIRKQNTDTDHLQKNHWSTNRFSNPVTYAREKIHRIQMTQVAGCFGV